MAAPRMHDVLGVVVAGVVVELDVDGGRGGGHHWGRVAGRDRGDRRVDRSGVGRRLRGRAEEGAPAPRGCAAGRRWCCGGSGWSWIPGMPPTGSAGRSWASSICGTCSEGRGGLRKTSDSAGQDIPAPSTAARP